MCSLDLDVGDADAGGRLPVTDVTPVVLPPLELHHEHLARAALPDDLARHSRRLEAIRSNDDLAVARDQKHGCELHGCALVPRQLLDRDDLAWRHAVLLAPSCDDRFHDRQPSLNVNGGKRLSDHTAVEPVNSCPGDFRPAVEPLRGGDSVYVRAAPSFMYSDSRLRSSRRDRCTRDFTAGRLIPRVSAISGFDIPSTSCGT